MGIKRIVDTSFWTDGKVDEFTPEDKYFMLYLLTNPFTTQLGIYEISVKQVAFHMGYSPEAVRALLERFESKHGIIAYSKATNEIAVKNYLRHSIIKGGAPVRDCLVKEIKRVKNKDLLERVFAHVKGYEGLNETVAKIIAEYEETNGVLRYCNEKQNDNENENENDNDNEVSCPDTSDVSSEPKKKRPKPFDELIDEYTENAELRGALRDYVQMRTAIRKKMTNRALELAFKELDKLGSSDWDKIAIVNQSIMNSWQGLFPLKGNASTQAQSTYETERKRLNEENVKRISNAPGMKVW